LESSAFFASDFEGCGEPRELDFDPFLGVEFSTSEAEFDDALDRDFLSGVDQISASNFLAVRCRFPALGLSVGFPTVSDVLFEGEAVAASSDFRFRPRPGFFGGAWVGGMKSSSVDSSSDGFLIVPDMTG